MTLSETLEKSYSELMEKTKELILLQTTGAIIHWDMETKMPPKGVNLRSQQLALLQKIGHKMLTDPKIGKLIDEIVNHQKFDGLDKIKKRNLHLIKKEYDEATKLPEELVVETAKQQAITVNIWKKAKAAKDYNMFKPELEKLYNLRLKAAEILMDVKKTPTPYEALIDLFEPGMKAETISMVFDDMKKGLIKIIDECKNTSIQPETSFLNRKIPVATQREIAEALTRFIGYDVVSDNAGGRIDETEHPFSTGYFDDIRITTHYYEDKFASSIFSVMHEGGHALYEQGFPHDWIFQPVGTGCSMGIHESQSRLIENIIGRGSEFWSYFLPQMKKMTSGTLSDVDLDTFVKAINKVEPSKIRIEADEVTYGLHIIIRFEIEKDLFDGKLTIDELPQIWNEKYRNYLDVKIDHDSEGVMQDTHWASGLFGYFPSYALGNIYGGQMLEKMNNDLPDWRNNVADGSFTEVKTWLVDNVHKHGNLYDPTDLVKLITGEELTTKPFINYLNVKFSRFYGY